MKRIQLNELNIKNFKGIKKLKIEPKGKDLNIYGSNSTGKTTIVDAWFWLLFNKNSKDQSTQKFDIKPLQENGEAVHQIETSVKATLDINNSQLTLEKVYKEVWQKKRGSNQKQFQGHTTNYFLSGAKVKKKEYEERISEIIDEDIFRLITDPLYFNEQLHWSERREVLTQLVNGIDNEEVIAQDESLEKLADVLKELSIDQHKKALKRKMNDLNEEIEKIPIRIDETTQNLPDIQKLDENEIKKNIEKLKQDKKKKEKELSRVENGGEVAQKEKELAELETELQKIKNEHTAEYEEKIENKKEELEEIKDEIRERKSDIKDIEGEISREESLIEYNKKNMKELKEEWYELADDIKKLQNDEWSGKTKCHACGQQLPEEKIEEAKKQFNRDKAEKIEKKTERQNEINQEGKQLKKEVIEANEKIEDLEDKIKKLNSEIEKYKEQKSDINAEINNLQQKKKRIYESDTYQSLEKDKKELKQQIKELKNNGNKEVGKLEVELQGIEKDIEREKEKLSNIKQHEKGQKRIEELKEKEEDLAAKYEELERKYYLCEQFEKERAELLEDKVNDLFNMANFKLFEEQINGGIKPTCQTLYRGVPFNTGLNDGNRIKVGLDIIKTLSNYYEVKAPIMIDNSESITGEVKTDSQLIKLIVDPKAENLKIENLDNQNYKEVV